MHSNTVYEPVPSENEDDPFTHEGLISHDPPSSSRASRKRGSQRWLILLILTAASAVFISGGICFSLGRHFERHIVESDWFSPPGQIDHEFTYRREFGLRPGNQSQVWWDKVFPRGRGFVQNDDISPTPHGLAVFHQLHCLDALRHGYWAAIDRIEPDHLAKPGHIRHCIDYLRQSIMCHADTNLEPISPELGGVTGYGFVRKCRDIVRLIHWAEKWRTHDQTNHG
ncbi:hypothetical protein F5Y11DRAFT_321522 [Daldinia sp. FL1419]|nr:hypothetical protein F5Y11DRAFT_321522 [Daldinia sp. FL1419]